MRYVLLFRNSRRGPKSGRGRTRIGQELDKSWTRVGLQIKRIVQSKAIEEEIRNNQIVLYRREYKVYIQEVRITEAGTWLERKRNTIREQ